MITLTTTEEFPAIGEAATAVEFAVCLPVLLAFVFGILEFSRATQLQQSTRLAAFEGARAGITLDAASSDVTTAVNRVMSAVSISNFSTTVSPSPLTYTSPTVTVTVNLDPTQNAWFTWFVPQQQHHFGSSVTSAARSEQRVRSMKITMAVDAVLGQPKVFRSIIAIPRIGCRNLHQIFSACARTTIARDLAGRFRQKLRNSPCEIRDLPVSVFAHRNDLALTVRRSIIERQLMGIVNLQERLNYGLNLDRKGGERDQANSHRKQDS